MTTLTSDKTELLAPGTLVAGKYTVVEKIGEGGFATVYRAQHAKISSLQVALKVLRREQAEDAQTSRRFRSEAEMAAALSSRFIVRILDAGETQDGRPFIAMEFIKGSPLDALLRQCGRLHEADVFRFAQGVLRALETAHSAGIVHRDLKPANVFAVEEDGDPPRAMVVDFGIAKIISPGALEPGTQTIAGNVVCTPQYAAPELLHGTVTPQIDLYALGHMMAELLDGECPYGGPQHAVLIAAEHLKPDPVPLGPWTQSSALFGVIQKACEKDPEARYASASDMLADLNATRARLGEHNTEPLVLSAPYTLSLTANDPRDSERGPARTGLFDQEVTPRGPAGPETDPTALTIRTTPEPFPAADPLGVRSRALSGIGIALAVLLSLGAAFVLFTKPANRDAARDEHPAAQVEAPAAAVPAANATSDASEHGADAAGSTDAADAPEVQTGPPIVPSQAPEPAASAASNAPNVHDAPRDEPPVEDTQRVRATERERDDAERARTREREADSRRRQEERAAQAAAEERAAQAAAEERAAQAAAEERAAQAAAEERAARVEAARRERARAEREAAAREAAEEAPPENPFGNIQPL